MPHQYLLPIRELGYTDSRTSFLGEFAVSIVAAMTIAIVGMGGMITTRPDGRV